MTGSVPTWYSCEKEGSTTGEERSKMNRWILWLLTLCLLLTSGCGREADREDPEVGRPPAEGIERVLEAARAFRHKVQSENRAGQPGREYPKGDQGHSRPAD